MTTDTPSGQAPTRPLALCAGIAVLAIMLVLPSPSGMEPAAWRVAAVAALMDCKTAQRLPWGVMLRFGGGLSLASGIAKSGLAAWIGTALAGLAGWPILLVIVVVTAGVIFLTEITSNTATAAAFLPLAAAVTPAIGVDPFVLTIPAALAASCAFMLPVAAPPNAIVYGSGHLTVAQMARAGFLLNVAGTLVIVAATLLVSGRLLSVAG